MEKRAYYSPKVLQKAKLYKNMQNPTVKKRIDLNQLKEYVVEINDALKKALSYSQLSEYGPLIYETITKYNTNAVNKTMMVKGPRRKFDETTQRESHQENVEYIASQIAEKLGLNVEIVGIMARNHDVGHTFLGHSGEWWISNVKKDLGLGFYCHNALGPRDLIYNKRIYEEILNTIKEKHPDISENRLKSIKNSLWLIMEGINSHNGESSENEYIANAKKIQDDFLEEMIMCHIQEGYDRNIVPATPEAALMRLCDKISYTPYDMVDGLREGFINELTDEYKELLIEFGITQEMIDECEGTKDYVPIAREIQEILIKDVIETSRNGNKAHKTKNGTILVNPNIVIRMSEEKAKLMHRLRDLNNKEIVNYVVLQEDADVYIPAVRNLMEIFKEYILNRINSEDKSSNSQQVNSEQKYSGLVNFYESFTDDENQFVKKMLKRARAEAIEKEVKEAEKIAGRKKSIEELEIQFPERNERIKKLSNYLYQNGTEVDDEFKKQFIKGLMLGERESFAYEIAARYLSTLDDEKFMQTLLDFGIIDEEKMNALTIPYCELGQKKIRAGVYKDPNWTRIQNKQKALTEAAMVGAK